MLSKVPEALPLSVIEAFSTGLIVIANPIGSLTEMIENGINGLFMMQYDPQSLPNLIHEIKIKNMILRKSVKMPPDGQNPFLCTKQLARFEEILEERSRMTP